MEMIIVFPIYAATPIASVKIQGNTLTKVFPDSTEESYRVENNEVTSEIHQFTTQFEIENDEDFKFINNGLFGYTSYDAVKYFETINIASKENSIEILKYNMLFIRTLLLLITSKMKLIFFLIVMKKKAI